MNTPEKTYGRVDPEERQRAYRKTRRRCCIIVASTLILLVALACLIVGVLSQSRKSRRDGNEDGQLSQGMQAIQAACNTTLFPDFCIKQLSSRPDALDAKPTQLVTMAVQIALEHANDAFDLAGRLLNETGMDSNTTYNALQDCLELMDDARDRLNESISQLSTLNSSTIREQLIDTKIWVSGALTYQTVCSDGFSNISNKEAGLINDNQDTLSQAIIVAFGLVNTLSLIGEDLSTWKDSLAGHPRNLRESLPESGNDELPVWLSFHQRKLLQASPGNVITSFPPNVIVAADGTGNYKRIQDAVDKAPKNKTTRYVIYIKAGHYPENVIISKKHTNLVFLGDGIGKTVISGERNVASGLYTTFRSATVAVSGKGFLARGITFTNNAGPSGHQAVALRVGADHAAFDECSFEGYQDTLYALTMRQFYRSCLITGTVDFIFGNAAAIFQSCTLRARQPGSGQTITYTAQGRKIADDIGGYSFQACHVTSESTNGVHHYLGRPWKAFSRTVFMKSNIDGIIHPAGWLAWNASYPFVNTLYYGEYQNYGDGSGIAGRVDWKGVHSAMTLAEAQVFTVDRFISGTFWLPATNVEFIADITR